MKITISNKIRIQEAPDVLKEILIDTLRVDNPKYSNAVSQGYRAYGINPHIYHFSVLPDESLTIPRGFRLNLLNLIKKYNIDTEIIDKTTYFPPNFDIDSSVIKFRTYQALAVKRLIGEREGLLVAPPGSGKTVMGISLLPLLGQPMLWLTHTDRLVKQTLARVNQFLPSLSDEDKGIIGGGKWDVGKLFTIGMIQTLIRRPEQAYELMNKFGIIILDEAHHCPANTFLEVVSKFNPYFLYGLTATPYRRDKLEKLMFQSLGSKETRIPLKEVEKEGGVIVPIVVYKPIESKTISGTNTQKLLTEYIVPNDKRNGIIVGDVLKEAMNGNFCIVISDRRAHCENLYELIKLSWEKTGIATGKYSKKYVDEQVEKYYKNEITVLVCTFALLGEGFDVDFLNRAFIASPFRAEGKVEQLLGRIQRTAPETGKKDAVVYDYVDVDVGVFKSQFFTRSEKGCRCNVYERLGAKVVPYSEYDKEK